MTDDQGDAEFEASLAGMPQPGADAPAGGAGGDQALRELRDLRAGVEEMARRMGAGFREDLAQIRAIAASVAERDLTDDIRALRSEVEALTGRDDARPVLDELAAVRDELRRLAPADEVAGVRADLAPLQATLDRIAARLDDDGGRTQVLARFQAIEAKLDAMAGTGEAEQLASRLDAAVDTLTARLDGLATSAQVGGLAADLRAHLADALGGLDGDAVLAEIAGLRAQLGTDRGTVVEQLQDNLADVASGEVVGALWDEVRALRAVVDSGSGGGGDEVLESIATLRSEVEGIGAAVAATAEPTADPAVAAMRDDVQALVDEVRALSDAVATVERDVAAGVPVAADAGADQDALLVQVTEELATLRGELAEGLVVEPSDALSASLDALRVEIDSLHATLGQVQAPEASAPEAATGPSADLVATVFDELATIRAGVDEVRGRLEEGLVLEHDVAPASPAPAELPAELEAIGDQVAGLRDLVLNEIDGLRQAVVAAAERDELPAAAPAPAGDVRADLAPETLELLRDEIRSAGEVGDQVLDAVREELRALRRRMAVKAAERVLDDDQLAQIADAVAERLGRE